MKSSVRHLGIILCASFSLRLLAPTSFAHDLPGGLAHELDATNAVPLPFAVEKRGPGRAPKAVQLAPGTPVTGQGFWKFIAARKLTPVPAAALPKLVGAHGTISVDKASDVIYWGWQGVGWIGFSTRLQTSWIVVGDGSLLTSWR